MQIFIILKQLLSLIISNIYLYFSQISPDDGQFTGRFTNIGEDSFDYETIEQGTWRFYDGDVYIGSLKEQRFHGKGCIYFKNGKVEISEFINNLANGPTLIKNSDGNIIFAYFSNDEEIILNSH